MIMHLDYEFEFQGKTFRGVGVDIGDTIDLETEAQDTEGLKVSAICHALDLSIDEFDEKYNLDDFNFDYCDLEV